MEKLFIGQGQGLSLRVHCPERHSKAESLPQLHSQGAGSSSARGESNEASGRNVPCSAVLQLGAHSYGEKHRVEGFKICPKSLLG